MKSKKSKIILALAFFIAIFCIVLIYMLMSYPKEKYALPQGNEDFIQVEVFGKPIWYGTSNFIDMLPEDYALTFGYEHETPSEIHLPDNLPLKEHVLYLPFTQSGTDKVHSERFLFADEDITLEIIASTKGKPYKHYAVDELNCAFSRINGHLLQIEGEKEGTYFFCVTQDCDGVHYIIVSDGLNLEELTNIIKNII